MVADRYGHIKARRTSTSVGSRVNDGIAVFDDFKRAGAVTAPGLDLVDRQRFCDRWRWRKRDVGVAFRQAAPCSVLEVHRTGVLRDGSTSSVESTGVDFRYRRMRAVVGVDEDVSLEYRPRPTVGVGSEHEIVGDVARVERTDRSKRIVIAAFVPQHELRGQVGGLVLVDDQTILVAAQTGCGAAVDPAESMRAKDAAQGNTHKQTQHKKYLAHHVLQTWN